MAKKVIFMKLLQEIRGHASVTNRRPTPATPTLYLMQLRRRNAYAQGRPQPPQRLAITAQWQNPGEAPSPIKINHTVVDGSETPIAMG